MATPQSGSTLKRIGTGRESTADRIFAPVNLLGTNWLGSNFLADLEVPPPSEVGAIRPSALWLFAAPDGTDPGTPDEQILAMSEQVCPRVALETGRRTGDFTLSLPGAAKPFQWFIYAEYR